MKIGLSSKLIVCVVAGLVAPLFWTPLESWLIFIAMPSNHLAFRIAQVLVGFISGLLITFPVIILLKPIPAYFGLAFAFSFLVSVVVGGLLAGSSREDILLVAQLPDFYAFIAVAGALFLWASRGLKHTHAAQPGVQADVHKKP